MQGIYKIVNNKNNKVYIGYSTDIERRFKEHLNGLGKNKHHAYKLQDFYNKNKNKKGFKINYEILELVDKEKYLPARETYYIKLYNSYENGYNSMSTYGNPVQTKKKDAQNKRIARINKNKDKLQYFANKYKNNLYLQYMGYSNTYLYRVICAIEYFIKNYNLDLYKAEISQCKSYVRLEIIDKNFQIVKIYDYKTKYKGMGLYRYNYEVLGGFNKSSYERYKMFNNIVESKNRYKWFLQRFARLDEDIIKYNSYKYYKNKYKIRFKDIRPLIGYEYGQLFKKHIIEDTEIEELSKKLGIFYNYGCVEIDLNIY